MKNTKAMTRLAEKYNKEIVPQMMERFGYKNKLQVPKVKKLSLIHI